MRLIRYCTFLIIVLLATSMIQAQSTPKQKAEKRFTGTWLNKKSTRVLEIYIEGGYVTIMDWTKKFQKRESADVYKAFLKNGKLVMPEETEHHAPYSEIRLENNTLIYLTKITGIDKSVTWDKLIFTRTSN